MTTYSRASKVASARRRALGATSAIERAWHEAVFANQIRGMTRNGTTRFLRLIAIGNRDGWVCHLCGEVVTPRAQESNEPTAPSFDHLKPRSRGGPFHHTNLKLAHVKCNQARGDRELEPPAC